MRSLFGSILNQGPPVPLVGRRFGSALGGLLGSVNTDRESQLAATEGNSTLFAVVDALATGVAEAGWHMHQRVRDKGSVCQYVDEVGRSCEAPGHRWIEQHAALTVWDRPNPWFTRQEFVEVGQQHQELTGENWWVITRVGRVPVELWPIRPDRMNPVPHPTKYLSGYTYTSPDGEQVPLKLDEVIFIRRPHPRDPYRGMSPVHSLMVDLDSANAAAEWNRAFFHNSAEPGGVIEVEKVLTDPEFDQMVMRWNESHKGVARAHRVAVLEHGKFVERGIKQRDMQFAELRGVSREIVREAYRLHGHMLGLANDVNLANALAADVTFARRLVRPRLGRWAGALNNDFIRIFAGGNRGDLRFVPDNPVPDDREQDSKDLVAKTQAVQRLVASGYDRTEVLAAVGLPDIAVSSTPVPAPGVPPQPGDDPVENEPVPGDDPVQDAVKRIVSDVRAALGAARPRVRMQGPDDVDLSPVQAEWERLLDALLAQWGAITTAQREQIRQQVEQAIEDDDLARLADLDVSSEEAAALLLIALTAMAEAAGQHVVEEAAAQGVTIAAIAAASDVLDVTATTTAALLATGLGALAGREALRLYGPESTAAGIAREVDDFLAELGDSTLRGQLGAALTKAQNLSRAATMAGAPTATYYATERLDANTCAPCEEIDGTRLDGLMEAITAYSGGYFRCVGAQYGNSCRGTFVAVWEQTDIEVPE